MTQTVVIEVQGGIAYCKEKPVGVKVEIIDHDNDEGNGPSVETHNAEELITSYN